MEDIVEKKLKASVFIGKVIILCGTIDCINLDLKQTRGQNFMKSLDKEKTKNIT